MTVQKIQSLAEFDALRGSGKTFYIDFYADWCGPCRVISPAFEKAATEHAKEGEVEFYKVDIDQVNDLAEALGIRSIPTFHAYKGDQRVDAFSGANPGKLNSLIQAGLRV